MADKKTITTECQGYDSPCGRTYEHEAMDLDGDLVKVYGFGFPWNLDLCPACLERAEEDKRIRDARNAELLMPCPPKDWSPDDAGEHWGAEDY